MPDPNPVTLDRDPFSNPEQVFASAAGLYRESMSSGANAFVRVTCASVISSSP